MRVRCTVNNCHFISSSYRTQSSVRAPNMADSLSQYSKHSDDLAQSSAIQAMMDPETKSRVSGVNNNKGAGGGAAKNDKFVKTMKKLPDVKMGHLEGKNLTFSSDSEDPNNNFVRISLVSNGSK